MTGNTMDIQLLTTHLSVSPQILVSDMQALSEAGFKSIICNRPDGEGPDQPRFAEMRSSTLWTLSQSGMTPQQQILEASQKVSE